MPATVDGVTVEAAVKAAVKVTVANGLQMEWTQHLTLVESALGLSYISPATAAGPAPDNLNPPSQH
eukprot:1736103-Rhodomonas_salina.2